MEKLNKNNYTEWQDIFTLIARGVIFIVSGGIMINKNKLHAMITHHSYLIALCAVFLPMDVHVVLHSFHTVFNVVIAIIAFIGTSYTAANAIYAFKAKHGTVNIFILIPDSFKKLRHRKNSASKPKHIDEVK